jgi:hypothetical protein
MSRRRIQVALAVIVRACSSNGAVATGTSAAGLRLAGLELGGLSGGALVLTVERCALPLLPT